MQRERALRLLALLLLGLPVIACAGQAEVRGPFRGEIVDQETGRPIEGAVVLAVWETLAVTPLGHGGQAFYDAREAIANSDGHFEVPQLPVPFGTFDLQPPRLYIFAPGYALASRNGLPVPIHAIAERIQVGPRPWVVTPPDGQRFVAPTVVQMRPIKTKEEWCHYAFYLPPLEHSRADKMPLTLEAIERERSVRGRCQ